MTGVGARFVISHPAPTSCIQEAMFTNRMAIHSMRNTGWRIGVQAPVWFSLGMGLLLAAGIFWQNRFFSK